MGLLRQPLCLYIRIGGSAMKVDCVFEHNGNDTLLHARAMYRMAEKTFGEGAVPDIFHFFS